MNQIEGIETESTKKSYTDTTSWREPPEPIDEELITDAGTFDIVIVGAGTAGLLCARVASMNGASVAVIENQTEQKYTGYPSTRLLSKQCASDMESRL